MRTGEDGSFEHYARPSDSVVVGTHDDVNADLFDPERVELPFGSEGLLITRKAVLEEEQVRFEVTDARNGSPIEDGGVSILRGTPREWGGWARGSISQGVAQLEVRPRPDLRYRVEVAGFLFHEAPLPIDRDGPIRIALEPGFEARLLVLDARTGAPVVGARFGDRQGHVAAVSDTTGCVHLRSSTWPEELVVQHADYETKLFLGRGGAESVGDRIVLQPR